MLYLIRYTNQKSKIAAFGLCITITQTKEKSIVTKTQDIMDGISID
jgi:hypothetical protein